MTPNVELCSLSPYAILVSGQDQHRGFDEPDPVRPDLDWLYESNIPRRRPIFVPMLLAFTLIFISAIAMTWSQWGRQVGHGASLEVPVHRLEASTTLPPIASAPFAPASLRSLSPQMAREFNEAVALDDHAIVPARAFLVDMGKDGGKDGGKGMTSKDRGMSLSRSLDCLTAAVYYEAANEPLDGQRAVAQVVLNRVRHPAYPHSVCAVVFQGAQRPTGCQFTFACDGALARAPVPYLWARAREVASAALGGYVHAPVGWATHYHANYVVPYWAASLSKIAAVGTHIFYRWQGGWGEPKAFSAHYSGQENLSFWQEKALVEARDDKAPKDGNIAASVALSDRPIIGHDGATMGANNDIVPASRAVATAPGQAGGAAAERWIISGPFERTVAGRASGSRAVIGAATPAPDLPGT
ncbi:cell wall hydrolase [Sphingobium sp.]|uniref:cell wall hydrolase n=1 Tax=Sphingobium sp. TaxID=1912891 RepID=UPI00257C8E97|nr:cell wall hydrolase [Sphingobium sp.]